MSDNEENASKKPKVSNFTQQSLPSWNPLILISTIYPLFGCIGLAFIAIGVGLLLSSFSINEYQYDYTDCKEYNQLHNNYSTRICSEVLNQNYTSNYETCLCNINFTLNKSFNGQVYFYYSLKKFYQNHRKYFSSKDDKQLLGKPLTAVSGDCEPFASVKNGSSIMNYAPCGLIANSLFNDTFELFFINSSLSIPVVMSKKGIAWKVDVDLLYGKPENWKNTLKPMNWKESSEQRSNDSYKGDEDLLVWMRTAPLSAFKKLNGIIKHDIDPFKQGLPAGEYQILINYAYPVSAFGGRKLIFLSTTSAMGGKNNNLGIMYIALGSIHEIIACIFLIFTLCRRKKKGSYSIEMIKRPMNDKNRKLDTPLITSPSTPESYGLQDVRFQNEDNNTTRLSLVYKSNV